MMNIQVVFNFSPLDNLVDCVGIFWVNILLRKRCLHRKVTGYAYLWLYCSRLSSGRAAPIYTYQHPTFLPILGTSQLSYFSSVIGATLYCFVLICIWVITNDFEHLIIGSSFLYVFSSEITYS